MLKRHNAVSVHVYFFSYCVSVSLPGFVIVNTVMVSVTFRKAKRAFNSQSDSGDEF